MPAGEKAAHDVHDSIDAKGAGAHVADGASKPEHEDEHQSNARDLMRKERANGERPGVSLRQGFKYHKSVPNDYYLLTT
jgi:hypothetical protein